MTLELIEQHPSGEVGFEGTAWVSPKFPLLC
jgi:hypothetical protein